MKALMALALVLFLAGCVAGRGDGAGSTNSQEETTAYKEETTVLEAEGNLRRPPDSTLSYGGQEVKGELGSYCWTSGSAGMCADAAPPFTPPRKKTLTVPSGSEMVFRFGGQSPPDTVYTDAVPLNKKGQPRIIPRKLPRTPLKPSTSDHPPLKAHGSGVERTIPVELPQGEYVVFVDVTAPQGDASYSFRIMVE